MSNTHDVVIESDVCILFQIVHKNAIPVNTIIKSKIYRCDETYYLFSCSALKFSPSPASCTGDFSSFILPSFKICKTNSTHGSLQGESKRDSLQKKKKRVISSPGVPAACTLASWAACLVYNCRQVVFTKHDLMILPL
jgi:hypothetical protein